jgi:hypothetical protein
MNRQNIVKSISTLLQIKRHNATKFGVHQIFMAITLASISRVNRICWISAFSSDGLVKALLLTRNAGWLYESGLKSITQDADSPVKSVCGNQEGAAKGFNTTKKGTKSYHSLLFFISEMKLFYYLWF